MSLHCHKKKNNPNKPPKPNPPLTKIPPSPRIAVNKPKCRSNPFSVAVVADGSHRSQQASRRGLPGTAQRDRDVARQSLGGRSSSGRLTFPVSPWSLRLRRTKAPFQPQEPTGEAQSFSSEFLKYSPKTEKFCLPSGSGNGSRDGGHLCLACGC